MSTDYSIIGVQAIVGLIQNLSNLDVKSYSTEQLVTLEATDPETRKTISVSAVYVLTGLAYSFADLTQYLVIGGLKNGTALPPAAEGLLPTVTFLSVGAGTPVVLISAVTQVNFIKTPVIIQGTDVYLYHKGRSIPFRFYVADIDRLREQKATLLNIFAMPSVTYVLWDSFVVHMVNIGDEFVPVFYARINDDGSAADVKTMFDLCSGVLIGKIEHEVIWLYYSDALRLVNYYPSLTYANTDADTVQYLVSGGSSNFLVRTRGVSELTKRPFPVWDISLANLLDYRAPMLGSPNQLESLYMPWSVPLVIEDPVMIDIVFPNQITGPITLEAFVGINPWLGTVEYAFFQTTILQQTQSTIVQTAIPFVQATSSKGLGRVDTKVGKINLTYYYGISNRVFKFFLPDIDIQSFFKIMGGMISIDDLIKIPFYTDNRLKSWNYHEEPYVEARKNVIAPDVFQQNNRSITGLASTGVPK